MNRDSQKFSSHKIIIFTTSILLFLAVALAALPQSALAASCQAYYTVEKGDKTGAIAREFGVKWIEIAAANSLERPYQLTEGEQLCIPYPFSISLKNNLSVKNVNNLIKITASSFTTPGNYYVKVRDVTAGPGDWYKIGKMKVPVSRAVTSSFLLPKDLKGATFLQVCLKNGTTDDLICQTVRHIYR